MKSQMKLVMIRHGETPSNREHRYLGRTEEALSEAGKEKLLREKEQGRYPQIDILYASPMQRCLETAEILYPDSKVVAISEWREMDFGAFEGKNYLDLKDDIRYQEWIDSNGTIAFPQGESREGFIRRTELGMNEMLKQLRKIEKNSGAMPDTIGMIVHGGTIMALLNNYCGGEYFDYQVANGEGYQCRIVVSENMLEITDLEKL